MRITSKLSAKEYLRAMKGSLDPMFDFGMERMIGTIIGPFFSVTYCSGHEFNRKITNEKSRAIGFIREKNGAAEVYCIRLKGMTNPISMCILFALCIAMFGVLEPSILAEPAVWWGSLVSTIFVACITAVQDSLTERGQEGSCILTRFLHNPENFSKW